MTESPGKITSILQRVSEGDVAAREKLIEVVYDELRTLATDLMRRERPEHTLQPTALVNEASMRLLGNETFQKMPNRQYFFGAMARAMRRVLVDYARRRKAKRRGGEWQHVPYETVLNMVQAEHNVDLMALDEALSELAEVGPREASIVELRFFGGMEWSEIAGHLDVSVSTVKRDWQLARAWLKRRLNDE